MNEQFHCYRTRHQHRSIPLRGAMIMLAGVFLLFHSLGILPWPSWHIIPIMLILIGLHVVLGPTRGARISMLVIILATLCAGIISLTFNGILSWHM